ncbi:MAG: 23S rRNA (pseudouridine(1915)-N(3))-methyltransferase RlmH [Legionella sp.]|nr:23S rRNA (pseudouridine(1915)-N(3))-methyltransferase RlmH [Legionella sp.]
MLEITLVVMGNKMPAWVIDASNEFIKRLREAFKFNLIEIPLLRRTHTHQISQVLEKEAEKLHQALPKSAYLIALDAKGHTYTSEKFAAHVGKLQHITGHICFVIGGPEGLPQSLLTQSHERLSLSQLTLPHPIARIMLLEVLYRSWSILNNHPYHK